MHIFRHARAGRAAGLGAALLAAVLSSGCVVAPARGYYGRGVVEVAPPAPPYEVVGVAPFPGAIWIGGYWGWNGHRHVWSPGRWEAPRRGYRYEPHMWTPEGRGWRERPGRWAPVM